MTTGWMTKGVATLTAGVFGLTACFGCGDSSGGTDIGGSGANGGSAQVSPTTPAQLRDYESAAEDIVTAMDAVVQGVVDLDAALQAQDDAAVDAALDAQPARLDAVEDAIMRLEDAENALGEGNFGDEPGVVRQGLAFLPVLAALAGLGAFANFLRDRNNAANDARMRRDMAQDGIDNDTPGAIDAYQAAQRDLNSAGHDVIEQTTQQVVTQLVLSPVNPTSTAGLIIKEAAGGALQAGMTVLTSTSQCRSMPPADGCRVGTTRTDAGGQAQVPSGTVSVSISGNGIARIELSDVELSPDEIVEVLIDLVNIEDIEDIGTGGAGGSGGGAGIGGGGTGTGGAGGTDSGGAGTGGPGVVGACSHPDAVGTIVPVKVDIESQADVDALAGCTSVGGIQITTEATDVTSLAGLESLTEIVLVEDPTFGGINISSGSFEVWLGEGPNITDVSALRNLTRVEGHITINDLAGLREVDLSSLKSVGDARASNPGVHIGGDLLGLIDLSSLETVMGDLHFTATDLDSLLLPKLRTIEANGSGYNGSLFVSEADFLAILELPQLTSIADQLWITYSDGITSVQAPLLTSVGNRIAFENNTAITSIGLDSITSPVGGVYIFQNGALESIGLNGLPSVVKDSLGTGGNLTIEYNNSLTSIGFASLTSIAGTLDFAINDMLPSEMVTALMDRVTVGGI